VPVVRSRVRQALAACGPRLIGVSSAARGGDLIFIEELISLGGSAIVLLPFPSHDFKTTSVGQGWDNTFERLLASPRVDVRKPIEVQLPAESSERDAAYARCNVTIIDTAEQLAAEHGDLDPLFLAVYMLTETDRQGGTAEAFRGWTDRGHRLQIINPRESLSG